MRSQEAVCSPSGEVSKGRLGTTGWKEVTRARGPLQSLPDPGRCPSWFTLVAVCPCRWKARPPWPGEKTRPAGIAVILGSTGMQ